MRALIVKRIYLEKVVMECLLIWTEACHTFLIIILTT